MEFSDFTCSCCDHHDEIPMRALPSLLLDMEMKKVDSWNFQDRCLNMSWAQIWRASKSRCICSYPWWRHQMEAFSALLSFCAGNSPVTGEFPTQRPVTRSFDVFFVLGLNQHLSKQLRRRWFETSSRSLWRHINAMYLGNTLSYLLDHGINQIVAWAELLTFSKIAA